MEFGKVVEFVNLGDGFKRRKNIEEVELSWKKMKSGVGGLGQSYGRHGELTGAKDLSALDLVVWVAS